MIKKIYTAVVLLVTGTAICGFSAEDYTAAYNKGVGYINNYETELGVQELNKVIYSEDAEDALKAKSYFWIAFVAMMDGDNKKAENTFREMFRNGFADTVELSDMPEDIKDSEGLADIYAAEKKGYLKEKKKIDKKIGKYLGMADKYYKKGQLDKSQKYLDRIFELDDNNQPAMEIAIKIESRKKEVKAVEQEREKVDEYIELAKQFFNQGSPEKALEKIDLVLQVEPDNREAVRMKEDIENTIKLSQKESKNEKKPAVKKKVKPVRKSDWDPDQLYDEAVANIDDYEMEPALKKMNRIAYTDGIDIDLRIKAFFWTAFLQLFDGHENMAQETLKDMVSRGMGADYNVDNLPSELSQNIKLIRIYDNIKSQYAGADSQTNMIGKLLKDAEDAYIHRDYDSSEQIVGVVLKEDPQNRTAIKMQRKIQQIRKLQIEVHKDMADELYEVAKAYFDAGNYIGAMEEANSVLNLNSKYQKALDLFNRAQEKLNSIMTGSNEKDRRRFHNAVNYYMEGKFAAAARNFKKLSLLIPEVRLLLNQATLKDAERKNAKRAQKYYKEGLKARYNKRLHKSQEQLKLALFLNKYDLAANILLKEVEYEMSQ